MAANTAKCLLYSIERVIDLEPLYTPSAANIAFAQRSRSRATLGTLSQPIGDRASAVPFGCRKCFPLALNTNKIEESANLHFGSSRLAAPSHRFSSSLSQET